MRFCLLDQICSYEAGKSITTVKNVSLAEEYLADHFPEFPVLPGVFMLEAATQSGAWLVRLSEDYAHSIVVLHEARAVKYADFVTPGNQLKMTVEQTDEEERYVKMKFQGEVNGRLSVSGRIVLERYNLADEDPNQAGLDSRMIEYQRNQESLLTRGSDVATVAT